jgi:hypothetical protein
VYRWISNDSIQWGLHGTGLIFSHERFNIGSVFNEFGDPRLGDWVDRRTLLLIGEKETYDL